MSDSTGKPGRGDAPLRDAMRAARIEAAERSAIIVELRDAEAARLEILNDALDPVFAEIPAEHAPLFDRGISQGSQPRLWIDMVTHVAMGRDKRTYRFLHDTAHGRRVLAESRETAPVVEAVTRYVARRLVAREQMLAIPEPEQAARAQKSERQSWLHDNKSSGWVMLLAGIAIGAILAWIGFSFR